MRRLSFPRSAASLSREMPRPSAAGRAFLRRPLTRPHRHVQLSPRTLLQHHISSTSRRASGQVRGSTERDVRAPDEKGARSCAAERGGRRAGSPTARYRPPDRHHLADRPVAFPFPSPTPHRTPDHASLPFQDASTREDAIWLACVLADRSDAASSPFSAHCIRCHRDRQIPELPVELQLQVTATSPVEAFGRSP